MKSKKQISIEHFQNLVAVAYADGVINDIEESVLEERAYEYGLNAEDVAAVMAQKKDLEFKIPMNDEDKEEQLADAVHLSMSDGKVDDAEYELCLKIAQKLDFDKTYLDYIIKLTTVVTE